ncbi:hypothetical protein K2X85_17055 [bacterium]|nr:hypothetical protein [bacterium]
MFDQNENGLPVAEACRNPAGFSVRGWCRRILPTFVFWFGAVGLSGCLYAPASWSPDGSELALVTQSGDEEEFFPEGWLWHDQISLTADRAKTTRQIWVADLATKTIRQVHEGAGYFTWPGWLPGGNGLAFVEFFPSADLSVNAVSLSGRLELVRQFRDGRRESLHTEEGTWPAELIETLPSQTTACSSDGKFIAFAWLGSSRLKVLDVATRGVVAEWPQADLPSWSPTSQWLAFIDRGLARGIRVVPAGAWSQSLPLVRVTGVTQPVAWEPIGESFYVFRSTQSFASTNRAEFGIPRRVSQPRRVLARVHVPEMSIESVGPAVRPSPRENDVVTWSIAPDEEQERIFLATLSESTPPFFDAISLRSAGTGPSERSALALSSISSIGPGGLTLSRDGQKLAVRFGPNDPFAPVMLLDLRLGESRTLAPTMSARMRALRILVSAIAQGMSRPERATPPIGLVHHRPWDAASYAEIGVRSKLPLGLFRLPSIQGPAPPEVSPALRRLMDEACLLVSEALASAPSPVLSRQLAEIRFYIEYAAGRYSEALDHANQAEQLAQGKLSEVDKQSFQLVRIQCLAALDRRQAARWEIRDLFTQIEDQQNQEKTAQQPVEPRLKTVREEMLSRLDAIEQALSARSPAETPRP